MFHWLSFTLQIRVFSHLKLVYLKLVLKKGFSTCFVLVFQKIISRNFLRFGKLKHQTFLFFGLCSPTFLQTTFLKRKMSVSNFTGIVPDSCCQRSGPLQQCSRPLVALCVRHTCMHSKIQGDTGYWVQHRTHCFLIKARKTDLSDQRRKVRKFLTSFLSDVIIIDSIIRFSKPLSEGFERASS